ncbi:MAG TPA: tripartite tricarboxylate transporter substrate binding protein [Hyphomicrobiaceae bacterium]|jgi:tripartite-type tricarboxylate transporter receptor subunit TctC|nr:tripartite tricarboxylate transporter substrate binding protein [Hyphomicrobiaceae bacterium]
MSGIALAAALVATAGTLPLTSVPAWADTWPSKPIKIICAFPAGGLADIFARAYGEFLSQKLGQPVVVENRTGAMGSIAAQAVKTSPPDGYTLLVAITATLAQSRVLLKNLPYDPDKDFTLISSMSAGQLPFVASKGTSSTNLKEFIEYARKNPTNVGTFGAGSQAHIVIAELNKHFGVDMKPVHYRGEAPMWQDLAAGVLQAAIGSYPNAMNMVELGAGRMLAVTMTKRNKRIPDVPTFVEQGITSKVFALYPYVSLIGPAGTPQDIVERLSALMVEAGKSERVQKLLDSYGIEEAALDHVEFKKRYEGETPVWVDAVKALGLAPQ